MEEFIYTRENMLEAMQEADRHDADWLWQNYPRLNGQARPSRSRFLLFDGKLYMLKPIARLANEIGGKNIQGNPTSDDFARYATIKDFDVINTEELTEAELAGALAESELVRRTNTDVQITIRNPRLAQRAKERDHYRCQACEYKMEVGGNYVIDAHHIMPIAQQEEGTVNSVEDLVCLCPNCHRIAHMRYPKPYTVDKIRKLIGASKVS